MRVATQPLAPAASREQRHAAAVMAEQRHAAAVVAGSGAPRTHDVDDASEAHAHERGEHGDEPDVAREEGGDVMRREDLIHSGAEMAEEVAQPQEFPRHRHTASCGAVARG